jgi:hypothetical protein
MVGNGVNNNMKSKYVLPLILIALAVMICGCAHPATSQESTVSPASSAVKVKVIARELNWDNEPGTDGLRVWVDLLDAQDGSLKYGNANLPVALKIRPSPTETMCEADSVLYVDNTTLKDWHTDSFAEGNPGVKDIPWGNIDQRQLGQLQKYGLLDAIVTLPDGKQIVGSLNEIAIKP